MKQVHWKQGAGTLLLGVIIMMMAVAFMVLIMECANIQLCQLIADTRCDLIADSTAVYAQSYDFKYNKGQAMAMTELLTEKNNEVSSNFQIKTDLSFLEDDTLSISCACETKTFYPQIIGVQTVIQQSVATVKSVDVYGDILYVPDLGADTP